LFQQGVTLRDAAGAFAEPSAARVRSPLGADLAEKVSFLSDPSVYRDHVDAVILRETHMSWVFLAGPQVYKLKKPVRFPYLDFSTLARREAACRAELRLNRRLAGEVYVGMAPLMLTAQGLALGPCRDGADRDSPCVLQQGTAEAFAGKIADWLVVMQRLDERCMLDHAIAAGTVTSHGLDRLVTLLTRFYRSAAPVRMTAQAHLSDWRQSLADNRRALADPRAQVPTALAHLIGGVQERFVARYGELLAARARQGRIVDAHGDLRPEHIWLGDPPRIIDCLEFNDRLRANDPFDEIAFLVLECERLGSPFVARYLGERLTRAVPHPPPAALIAFYRCHRASLRARLAVAHLFEENPRTPEKWPAQARAYLRLVVRDALRLDALLRR
jgi:aminoglycoside phosphotransferase family enzyme